MDTFGARLRRAREASGLTQPDITAELAQRGHDIGQSTVSHYEIGRTQPKIEVIAALASILGVSCATTSHWSSTTWPTPTNVTVWWITCSPSRQLRQFDVCATAHLLHWWAFFL